MPNAYARLLVAVAALALVQVGLFFWYLQANLIQAPFADMSPLVRQFLEYRDQGGLWDFLLAPHNEHRPVFLRLLVAFDVAAFAGVGYPFVVVAGLCLVGTAWLAWRVSRAELAAGPGRLTGALGVMVVLTSVAAVDAAIPLMNSYIHVIALGAAALVGFDRPRPAAGAVGWLRLGAVAAAVAAPFAHAEGWALWPVLLWLAWRAGAGRRWLLGLAALMAALLLGYWWGMPLPSPIGDEGRPLLVDLGRRLDYLVTFTGLPLTRAASLALPGRLFGAVVAGAGVWVAVRAVAGRGADDRLGRQAAAWVMFSLIMALMATAGRTDEPVEGGVLVPVRYMVLLAPLHVGLLWAAAPWLARVWGRARATAPIAAGGVGLAVALVGLQVGTGQAAVARTDEIVATIERFRAGGADEDMRVIISTDLDAARRELEMMRRAGVYTTVR